MYTECNCADKERHLCVSVVNARLSLSLSLRFILIINDNCLADRENIAHPTSDGDAMLNLPETSLRRHRNHASEYDRRLKIVYKAVKEERFESARRPTRACGTSACSRITVE